MDIWIVIFNNTNLAQFRITDAQVKLCGIYARVTCVENITIVVNGRVSEYTILATNIFIKRDKQWLLVDHHGSPGEEA